MKPLHPILVHFPIALLTLSVGADLIGTFADAVSLRHTGWWTLCAAALGGIAAAAAGIYDMRRASLSEDVHHRVHRHMRVGIVLVSAIVALTIWRWTLHSSGGDLPAIYLGLAVLTLGLGAFQGWRVANWSIRMGYSSAKARPPQLQARTTKHPAMAATIIEQRTCGTRRMPRVCIGSYRTYPPSTSIRPVPRSIPFHYRRTRMRLIPAILFSILLVLSLPGMAHQSPESGDPAAIKKVLGDYKAALERLDMGGADALFAKDNIVIENGKVEGSYADYLANHIGPELGHFSSFAFSDYNVSVQVHGDVAWATETYLYKITLKEEGKVIERQGVASSVLHRTDDGWRIVSMHGSSRAPKPKAAP